MSKVGQRERPTQKRVIRLFEQQMGYHYLGDWHKREGNSNVEEDLLRAYLKDKYSPKLIEKAIEKFQRECRDFGQKLYERNKTVYGSLRYGVKVKESLDKANETVWLINWAQPLENHFAIAEEVSIKGENNKRPDLVLYVNGIALGVIELKRSKVSVSEGIRQNLDSQSNNFIQPFFTTIQLVMAGNDSQGLRYGVIGTKEKYYLSWKEPDADGEYAFLRDATMQKSLRQPQGNTR